MNAEVSQDARSPLERLRAYRQFDLLAKVLVFFIALPLCLKTPLANRYPGVAGLDNRKLGIEHHGPPPSARSPST